MMVLLFGLSFSCFISLLFIDVFTVILYSFCQIGELFFFFFPFGKLPRVSLAMLGSHINVLNKKHISRVFIYL